MSEVWGHVTGIFIVLMMVAFIGIWLWAWLPRHRRAFGLLAHLPMEDCGAAPQDPVPGSDDGERR